MRTLIKPVAVVVMLLFASASFAQAGPHHHYKHHKHHKKHHIAHRAPGRPSLPPPPPHP